MPKVAQMPMTERMVALSAREGPWLKSRDGGGSAALQRHARDFRPGPPRLPASADDDRARATEPAARFSHLDRLGHLAPDVVSARLRGGDAGAREARRPV